ncbi:nonsense-mediated mrna [Nesidiocoris tenuis]|uniref:60S ribosomal export protein NMD3 n=1 Tax=Nesidiocoris tenuis TaxID=355587 RepID=A0ABN7AS17_9HEMI|nr:nonsense-mediated mrna [Nesidiocoris tenuis]
MEYISPAESGPPTVTKILCCQCGTPIEPNPANMCVPCLRSEIDITEAIPKQATIYFCRGCERYLQPPAEWVQASLESRELLSLCLKKLRGLNRVKLVDAGFIWTEPHSRRLKVKVTVQGEVVGGAVLEQVFVVEYVVAHQMCDDCHRVEAQNFWRAVVQVRQKAVNKKTFYYLEQLILKHKAHDNTLGIKPIHEGLDFFYATETHARKMIDFLNTVLPIRYQLSKRLLSHDVHSNIYNYKFTMSVEIVPISKDSLVCLSKKMAGQMGAIGQLCVVQRVTNSIHLIDPTTAQIAEVTGTHYWRDPFTAVCDPKQLVEYIVMDIDLIEGKDRNVFPGQGQLSHKHAMADVWVVRASDIGSDDAMLHTRTHIGHLLKVGDSALGYNVQDCNVNNSHFEKLNRDKMPDVVLVKKHYGDRAKKRAWKLKHLPRDDTSIGSANKDYAAFLNDLEEDPVYRQNVNIYRDPTKQIPVDADDVDDPFAPRVTLDEMLDEMHIVDDEEMAEGQ